MIYYFNIHFPDTRNKRFINYRDADGWILTYIVRTKRYGKLFKEYGYMYL